MKKEATLSYAIFYIIVFAIMIFVFVVGAPFLTQVNDHFHDIAIDMNQRTNETALKIQNVTVYNTMQQIISKNTANYAEHGVTLEKWMQYSWLFVLIVVTIVIVLLARKAEMVFSQGGVV